MHDYQPVKKPRVVQKNLQFSNNVQMIEIPRKESEPNLYFNDTESVSSSNLDLLVSESSSKTSAAATRLVIIIVVTCVCLIAGIMGAVTAVILTQKTNGGSNSDNSLNYNSPCTVGSNQCNSTGSLTCTGTCTCGYGSVWNVSSCVCPSGTFMNSSHMCETGYLVNHTCTIGSSQCDSTKGLVCNNSICQCDYSTQYWNINFQMCLQRLNYTEMCTADSDCISTLICPTVPGVCNCPQSLPDLVCNCANTKYYDSTLLQCVNRASWGGSCLTSANYTCLTSLYCNAGTCACPTGTTWIVASTSCVATG